MKGLKMIKNKIIFILFPLFFLFSCSETPLDLQVGDCYIDKSGSPAPGESVELGTVEIVNCTEPHNYEIIAAFPSVPYKYRSYDQPMDEACYSATVDYIIALHPYKNENSMQYIFGKFDERFSYEYNYTRISYNSMEPDLNADFNCAIFSKNSLIIGPFKKTIKSFN